MHSLCRRKERASPHPAYKKAQPKLSLSRMCRPPPIRTCTVGRWVVSPPFLCFQRPATVKAGPGGLRFTAGAGRPL